MKKDITDRYDVITLVNYFYEKVKRDDLIGTIFNDIAKVNWEEHLPVMYDFWENTLFYTGSYAGNPVEAHKNVNLAYPLKAAHFNRWLHIFNETVDELFEGEKAVLAKQRANSIATIIQIKLSKMPGISLS